MSVHVVRRPPIVPMSTDIITRNVIRSPKFARAFLFHKDRGVCEVCGEDKSDGATSMILIGEFLDMARAKVTLVYKSIPTVTGAWDADHVEPLHAVIRSKPYAWQFWGPNNLQTICKPCHLKKNDREAGVRGKVRRTRESKGLTKKRPNRRERYLARRKARVDWL